MDAYQNCMVEARVAFANRINKLIKKANAENLGFFLVYYASLGAVIHESMEKILKKASKRCQKMDYTDLANALDAQARLESDQCNEMKSDTKAWVDWWNQKQGLNLLAKDYLRHPTMPSMQAYLDLHEDIIKHQSPFAELAVGYEIQRTQMVHSFSLIKLAIFKLGMAALRKLRFVQRAAKFNMNRPLNKQMLMTFLATQPAALSVMTEKSAAALSAYGDFIEDCFKLAENEAKKYQLVEATT